MSSGSSQVAQSQPAVTVTVSASPQAPPTPKGPQPLGDGDSGSTCRTSVAQPVSASFTQPTSAPTAVAHPQVTQVAFSQAQQQQQQPLPPVSTLVSASLRPIAPAAPPPIAVSANAAASFPRQPSLPAAVKTNAVAPNTSPKTRIAPMPVQPRPPSRQPQTPTSQPQAIQPQAQQQAMQPQPQVMQQQPMQQVCVSQPQQVTLQAQPQPAAPQQPQLQHQQMQHQHVQHQHAHVHPMPQLHQLQPVATQPQQQQPPAQQQQQQFSTVKTITTPRSIAPAPSAAPPVTLQQLIASPHPNAATAYVSGPTAYAVSSGASPHHSYLSSGPSGQVLSSQLAPGSPVMPATAYSMFPAVSCATGQQILQPTTLQLTLPAPVSAAGVASASAGLTMVSVSEAPVMSQQQQQHHTCQCGPHGGAKMKVADPMTQTNAAKAHMQPRFQQPQQPQQQQVKTEGGSQVLTLVTGSTDVGVQRHQHPQQPTHQQQQQQQPVASVMPSVNVSTASALPQMAVPSAASPYAMSPVFATSSGQQPMMVNMMSMPQQQAAAFMGHSGILLHPMMPVQSFVTTSQAHHHQHHATSQGTLMFSNQHQQHHHQQQHQPVQHPAQPATPQPMQQQQHHQQHPMTQVVHGPSQGIVSASVAPTVSSHTSSVTVSHSHALSSTSGCTMVTSAGPTMAASTGNMGGGGGNNNGGSSASSNSSASGHRPVMPKAVVSSPSKASTRPLAPAPARPSDNFRPMASPTKMRAIMPSTSNLHTSSSSSLLVSSNTSSSSSGGGGGLFGLKRGDACRVLNFLSVKKKQALAHINKTNVPNSVAAGAVANASSMTGPSPSIAPLSGGGGPGGMGGSSGVTPLFAGIPLKRKRGRPPRSRPPAMMSAYPMSASAAQFAAARAAHQQANLTANAAIPAPALSKPPPPPVGHVPASPRMPVLTASPNLLASTNSTCTTSTVVTSTVNVPVATVASVPAAAVTPIPLAPSPVPLPPSPKQKDVSSPLPSPESEELGPLSIVTAATPASHASSPTAAAAIPTEGKAVVPKDETDARSPLSPPVSPVLMIASNVGTNGALKRSRKTGVVRPEPRNILTHVIDGQIIYESDKPFPVKNAMEVVFDTFGPPPAKSPRLQPPTLKPPTPVRTSKAPSSEAKPPPVTAATLSAADSTATIVVKSGSAEPKHTTSPMTPVAPPKSTLTATPASTTVTSAPTPSTTPRPMTPAPKPAAPVSKPTAAVAKPTPSAPKPSPAAAKPAPPAPNPVTPVTKPAMVHKAAPVAKLAPAAPVASPGGFMRCEFCGELRPSADFKASKRFCSAACIRKSSLLGKLPPKKPNLKNESSNKDGEVSGNLSIERPFPPEIPTSVSSNGQPVLPRPMPQPQLHQHQPTTTRTNYTPTSQPLSSVAPTPQVSSNAAAAAAAAEDVTNLTSRLGPMAHWSVEHVYGFVRTTPGCLAYAEAFRSNEIDGEALLLLKEEHLMQAPISMKLGPALKLSARIEEHRI